jgi:hypothetical protein
MFKTVLKAFGTMNRALVGAVVAVVAAVANATGLPDIAPENQGVIVEWVLTVVSGLGALVAAFSDNAAKPKTDETA